MRSEAAGGAKVGRRRGDACRGEKGGAKGRNRRREPAAAGAAADDRAAAGGAAAAAESRPGRRETAADMTRSMHHAR